MTRVRALCTSIVLLLAFMAAPVLGQTTLTSTTLSTAVNASVTQVAVASATNVVAGSYLVIDREAMQINSITGTVAQVSRGFAGTAARAHAASAVVYVGTPDRFYPTEVVGTCTATAEAFTPRIVLPTGNRYTCTGGYWNKIGADIGTLNAAFTQGGTAADALDTIFFTADRDYLVSKITAVWAVAEATGSMDIMVEKLTGTTACASGIDLMSAVIAGTGTANTVNTAALTATAANLLVATGDRICVDLSATPNEVANMVVTVTLVPR